MRELNFKLISNNLEIINEKASYFIKDNIINFCISDSVYKYDQLKKILIKKDKEKKLVINFDKLVIIIEVINTGLKFDYPISKKKKEISEKKVLFTYTLDSEETIENTIIIEF